MNREFIEDIINETGLCKTRRTKVGCKKRKSHYDIKISTRGYNDFYFIFEGSIKDELELNVFLAEADEKMFEEMKEFLELI